MGPTLSREATMQLHLRQDMAMDTVRRFVAAGFTTVYEDILIGADLARVTNELAELDPRIVVLNPSVQALSQRDADRQKTGYGDHFPPHVLADALRLETPQTGLWLDTSEMAIDSVVEEILKTW